MALDLLHVMCYSLFIHTKPDCLVILDNSASMLLQPSRAFEYVSTKSFDEGSSSESSLSCHIGSYCSRSLLVCCVPDFGMAKMRSTATVCRHA